ncbi:MAG TPA: AAA family ATPase [Thermoanaerobaculia bacterium]|nr:AAA family ATPase [Thermoanaerobaculia bacterium]
MLSELVARRLQLYVQEQDGPDALLHCGRKRTPQLDAELYFGRSGYRISLPESPRGPRQLSDGTLRFIALATLLLQPVSLRPATILIDEPELGLHPSGADDREPSGGGGDRGLRLPARALRSPRPAARIRSLAVRRYDPPRRDPAGMDDVLGRLDRHRAGAESPEHINDGPDSHLR